MFFQSLSSKLYFSSKQLLQYFKNSSTSGSTLLPKSDRKLSGKIFIFCHRGWCLFLIQDHSCKSEQTEKSTKTPLIRFLSIQWPISWAMLSVALDRSPSMRTMATFSRFKKTPITSDSLIGIFLQNGCFFTSVWQYEAIALVPLPKHCAWRSDPASIWNPINSWFHNVLFKLFTSGANFIIPQMPHFSLQDTSPKWFPDWFENAIPQMDKTFAELNQCIHDNYHIVPSLNLSFGDDFVLFFCQNSSYRSFWSCLNFGPNRDMLLCPHRSHLWCQVAPCSWDLTSVEHSTPKKHLAPVKEQGRRLRWSALRHQEEAHSPLVLYRARQRSRAAEHTQ